MAAERTAKEYYARKFPEIRVLSCQVDPDNWLMTLYWDAYPQGNLLAFRVYTSQFGEKFSRSIALTWENGSWRVIGEGF